MIGKSTIAYNYCPIFDIVIYNFELPRAPQQSFSVLTIKYSKFIFYSFRNILLSYTCINFLNLNKFWFLRPFSYECLKRQ